MVEVEAVKEKGKGEDVVEEQQMGNLRIGIITRKNT